jgi:hypothetical protein
MGLRLLRADVWIAGHAESFGKAVESQKRT